MLMMLCANCGIGGAEKRYARMFEMLVARYGSQHRLVITKAQLDLLQQAGILQHIQPNLMVLDPPFQTKRGPLFKLLRVFWYVWQCWRLIHKIKPDVVHPIITAMYLAFPALLLKPKVCCVMSIYSPRLEPEEEQGKLKIKFGVWLKRLVLKRAGAIDVLSQGIRDILIEAKVNDGKIAVSPCSFTDFSLCQPAPQKERAVVFLGRFVAAKNPMLFAQAIPKITAQESNVHFYMLGKGPLQAQIEEMLRRAGVAAKVTIGFEANPPQLLNRSAIFVSLQRFENYPSQSLLEAMACGNAIVATDVGETWRLVDETNGLRVPPTPEAVAEAVVKLLCDPNLPRLQQASRQRALTEHTPERFFDYIINVYQMVTSL
jgi:glycosyltransferase involved in cell wall biosynthesis